LFYRQARLCPARFASKFVMSAAPLARTSRSNKTPGDVLASLMPRRDEPIPKPWLDGVPYQPRHIDPVMLPEFSGGIQVQFV